MNELLFFSQLIFVVLFAFVALRLGQTALTCWVVLQALIANLFVLKQVTLFGFDVTASDVFAIGSLLGLHFLQENFSKKEAEKAVWVTLLSMLFFMLSSQLHLLYVPNPFDTSQEAFITIFSQTPRLFIASLSTFFIVQQLDVKIFALLKRRLSSSGFSLRTFIALIASQFFDTLLFSLMGLYGIVGSLWDVIIVSFIIKVAIVACFSMITKLNLLRAQV